MRSGKILFTLLLLAFCLSANAQWEYLGTFLFNIVDEGPPVRLITIQDVTSGNVIFLSDDSNSVITYDSVWKAFSFTTYGLEEKYLGIVYQNDTTVITYPSFRNVKSYYLRRPAIPLKGSSFSLYNKQNYDNLLNEMPESTTQILAISEDYTDFNKKCGMEEETKNIIKNRLIQTIKFRE